MKTSNVTSDDLPAEQAPASATTPTTDSSTDGPVSHGGDVYLSSSDLTTVTLRRLELENVTYQYRIKQLEAKQLELSFQSQIGRLQSEANTLQAEIQAKSAGVDKMKSEFSTKYGLDFDHATYDPVTGKISKTP